MEELFSLLNFLEPTRFASTEAFLEEFGNLKTESQVDKLKAVSFITFLTTCVLFYTNMLILFLCLYTFKKSVFAKLN